MDLPLEAALLVRDAQLTFFQAKQLKLGRYKRFTIGSKYRQPEPVCDAGCAAAARVSWRP